MWALPMNLLRSILPLAFVAFVAFVACAASASAAPSDPPAAVEVEVASPLPGATTTHSTQAASMAPGVRSAPARKCLNISPLAATSPTT